MRNLDISDYVLLAEASYADFSLSISALHATKIVQQKSAGCFSDVPSVKSSLHFINGVES